MKQIVISGDTEQRIEAALEWLSSVPSQNGVRIVTHTWEAADEVVRRYARRHRAVHGLHRTTLDRLAATLALPHLVASGRAPASALTLQAVVARTVFLLAREARLGYFAPVADRPGFPPAVAQTLAELRMEGVEAHQVSPLSPAIGDLALLAARLEEELGAAALADRADIYRCAVAAAATAEAMPLLLLDVPLQSHLEQRLIEALATRETLATVPRGDATTSRRLEVALGLAAQVAPVPPGPTLQNLKTHLFAETTPPPTDLDDSVVIRSWPGEARECVEIARAIQAEAAAGTPFDRMAVFVHAPAQYAPHLEEALARAEIAAYTTRGTARPHVAGRAFLALLACAAERLSARRFAEYLSLAQVPAIDLPPAATGAAGPATGGAGPATGEGHPARPLDVDPAWQPPRHDLTPPLGEDEAPAEPLPSLPLQDPDAAAVVGGTLQAPWRWEQLLVDAAVIEGRSRWAARLQGLRKDWENRRALLAGKEEARVAFLDRQLADLDHLTSFALPLVERLAALPRQATWGDWLHRLRALGVHALREPQSVLEVLAELEPMAPVGPVALDEVRLVLTPRLQDLGTRPPRRRHGAVFIAPAEAARGLSFDVVFVPGLVEKVFPQPVTEDPIMLDEARAALIAQSIPGRERLQLSDQESRAHDERLALCLAAGAARRRLHLSYPRLDVEQGRPRVPSFYALEALRAAEGVLPGFETLHRRVAEGTAPARLGWPAPAQRADAIDEAEYDLATLAPLLSASPADSGGTAHYLLAANPHLARALRFRAGRWRNRWSRADGLLLDAPPLAPHDEFEAQRLELAQEALRTHRFGARPFSPTALEKYAVCPYRFFLQAVQRLQPREEPTSPETLEPLTRGSLFHEVQFELLTQLQAADLLPLSPASLHDATQRLDVILHEVEQRRRDELAPAIPRVWDDGIAGVRADLREWLRLATTERQWIPWRFELSFGLVEGDRGQADHHSQREPVEVLEGLLLRGSIDLVERSEDGRIRATDHKTGRSYGRDGLQVQGGEILQPLLYALVSEKLIGDAHVESGRLYYCTADGGFKERVVPLETHTRETARRALAVIRSALDNGFLPAAPRADACRYCDYRAVCGAREADRVRRKPEDSLRDLHLLREMP